MIFNQILIVDSIPLGERNTARALHQDVSLRAQIFPDGPAVLYCRIESRDEFDELLVELAVGAPLRIPVLHVECHGSDQLGLQFADGSVATWGDLKPLLTTLNVASRLNLLVVIAACQGRSVARTLTMDDRAPFHGLIGAIRDVYPAELEQGFLAFYDALLATHSAADALAALRRTVPDTFVYWTAQWLFQRVWDYYQRNYETPEARLERARHNIANPPLGFEGVQVTVEQFVRLLEEGDRPYFEQSWRHFFLLDLYPEQEDAFPVQYAAFGHPLLNR